MTTLLVVSDNQNNLIFGADCVQVAGEGIRQKVSFAKITKRDDLVISGSGEAAVCDFVQYLFPFPKKRRNVTTYSYMMLEVLPELKRFLEYHGKCEYSSSFDFNKSKDDDKSDDKDVLASFLIGVESDLYELTVFPNKIYIDKAHTPCSGGCGGLSALAAYIALRKNKKNDKNIINDVITAVQISGELHIECGDKDVQIEVLYADSH